MSFWLILAAGAGSGCSTVGHTPTEPGSHASTEPVVVVGAGAAGLAAVHELEKLGISAELYTDQARLGGRIRGTTSEPGTGLTINEGAELVNTDDARLIKLAGELGLRLLPIAAPDGERKDDFLFEGRVIPLVQVHARALRESRSALARLQRDDRAVTQALEQDRAKIPPGILSGNTPGITPSVPPFIRKLDHQSIRDYLLEIRADPVFRAYLEAAMTSESGLPADRQSALALLDYFEFDARARVPFHLVYWEQEGYRIDGGMHRLIDRLAETQRSPLRTGYELIAVHGPGIPGEGPKDGGRFTLTFRTPRGVERVSARQVILAIPLPRLRQVDLSGVGGLTPRARALIDSASYGEHAKLILEFDRRIWREHGHSGSALASSGYQLWDSSANAPGPIGSLTAFYGAPGADVDEAHATEQVMRELDPLFPEARAHLRSARFIQWPHSYSARFGIGEFTRLTPYRLDPIGGLAFAGEHLSEEKWAYVEGALEAGIAAARAQAAALRKLQSPLIGTQVQ